MTSGQEFISFKVGEHIQWYVHVPEGTEPKGCGATIKIPGLGWGTEGKSKEEGHLTLTQGDNLVYEFTPDKTGDYIFSCWMGSGCHSNYIHVTNDGTYNATQPAAPVNIRAERSGNKINVSFDTPETPDGAQIKGYKIIAVGENGKKIKKTVQENSAVFDDLIADSSYTITVYTLATSGTSDGSNEIIVEASGIAASDNNTQAAEVVALSNNNSSESNETDITTTSNTTTTSKITNKTTSTTTVSKKSTSPQTGDHRSIAAELLLFSSLATTYLFRKRRS